MEGKGAFAKAFQKTLIRTKAKVLQNLGKAEKTTDDIFEDHVGNFTRQQAVAARLQKEVKHYVQCVRAMTAASKSLYTVIRDCYEQEWIDLHTVDSAIRSLDMLHSNYEAELFERVCSDLHTYVELFSPMKEKISKRGRKLLDYDNAKHSYESLLNAKRQDELKMAKAYESLQEAERLYNDLNTELHRELPKFYNYRIDFLSSNLSRLYSTDSTFHCETGKITNELHELMESIPKAEERAVCNDIYFNPMDHTGLDLSHLDKSMHSAGGGVDRVVDTQYPPHQEYSSANTAPSEPNMVVSADPSSVSADTPPVSADTPPVSADTPPVSADTPPVANSEDRLNGTSAAQKPPVGLNKGDGDTILLAESAEIVEYDIPSSPVREVEQTSIDGDEVEDSLYENAAAAVAAESEVTVGQQVLATHKYTPQDEDELSFEPGEIIDVVEFDDPDDEDEGWLMGISRSTGRKGVFPQNFTKKIVGRRNADS